jgi:hypothetical protein
MVSAGASRSLLLVRMEPSAGAGFGLLCAGLCRFAPVCETGHVLPIHEAAQLRPILVADPFHTSYLPQIVSAFV